MKTIFFLLGLIVILSAEPASAINYFWLTNYETTEDSSIIAFNGRDTLSGPVHSNDWIATQNAGGGIPFAGSRVSTTMPSFRSGSPNPAMQFIGGPPIFNATEVVIPEQLTFIREEAELQGRVFPYAGNEHYISIHNNAMYVYTYPEGIPLDTMLWPHQIYTLNTENYFFFDAKVSIRGVVPAQDCHVIIGSSHSIRLQDNVMLEGTNLSNGTLPSGATSAICLAAEHDVIIANTWENGRANQSGTPPNNRDIVITALVFALRGSFRSEQLNFEDDPYICSCSPDERGSIILTGGITQWRRGWLHTSNRGGTGYTKTLHYDERLRFWNPGVFSSPHQDEIADTLYFPDTPVHQTSYDTLRFNREGPFSGSHAGYPFASNAPYQFMGPFVVPVSFTPPAVGPWYGALTFFLHGEFTSIVLRGNGVTAGGPQIVSTEIVPNPFNVESRIELELAGAGHLRATVYDILGREVARLADAEFAAGRHTLRFDGSSLASGVYFLNLQTPQSVMTRKLLLLK